MNWRFIEQQSYSAAMNMAIDEAICESVVKNDSLPAIRFYKWKNNSVSIGSNQNQDEINLTECKKNKVDVVRRITGGRAVYHDKNDFTYSVIAHIKFFNNDINNAYSDICSWIMDALNQIGIKSELKNKNDIMADGKKISGNAAKLFKNGIYLQHGTLVYDIDFELMPKVMNISKELAKNKIALILQYKKISQEKVYETLKNNFIKNKNVEIRGLSKEELKRANELAKTKYSLVILPKENLLKNKGACYVEVGN